MSNDKNRKLGETYDEYMERHVDDKIATDIKIEEIRAAANNISEIIDMAKEGLNSLISKNDITGFNVNLNVKVRLKLTNLGKSINDEITPLYRFKDDANGYIECQLWEAMKYFGPYISSLQNEEQPIENITMEFINSDNLIKVNTKEDKVLSQYSPEIVDENHEAEAEANSKMISHHLHSTLGINHTDTHNLPLTEDDVRERYIESLSYTQLGVSQDLMEYIENNIIPQYENEKTGHGIPHIRYVINRSLQLGIMYEMNIDMCYTIAAYHDIGLLTADRDTHNSISASYLRNDENLTKYFDTDEINIMGDACMDHRASCKYTPRSKYGCIVSDADRDTDLATMVKRSYKYTKLTYSDIEDNSKIMDLVYKHLKEKYGCGGYGGFRLANSYLIDNGAMNNVQTILANRNSFDEFVNEMGDVLK